MAIDVDPHDLIPVLQAKLGAYLNEATMLEAACNRFQRENAALKARIADLEAKRGKKR